MLKTAKTILNTHNFFLYLDGLFFLVKNLRAFWKILWKSLKCAWIFTNNSAGHPVILRLICSDVCGMEIFFCYLKRLFCVFEETIWETIFHIWGNYCYYFLRCILMGALIFLLLEILVFNWNMSKFSCRILWNCPSDIN